MNYNVNRIIDQNEPTLMTKNKLLRTVFFSLFFLEVSIIVVFWEDKFLIVIIFAPGKVDVFCLQIIGKDEAIFVLFLSKHFIIFMNNMSHNIF